MTEHFTDDTSTPIIFLKTIGIAAGDVMRLMEAAKQLSAPVRWRMAPAGVAADAYLVHRAKVRDRAFDSTLPNDWNSQNFAASEPNKLADSTQVKLDANQCYRGRPVCLLGDDHPDSGAEDQALAPLHFPAAFAQLLRGLAQVQLQLVGERMLFAVGALGWEHRYKWASHHLQAFESGQLVIVIDPQNWQFYLREDCDVERLSRASMQTRPRSAGFAAEGFISFKFEAALWEYAKRCPEERLTDMLPSRFLTQPLTHRREPHLKDHALGEHCVSILRALDARAHTANELQASLRITRPSLMRALACLALVRAIQPQSFLNRSLKASIASWWANMTHSAQKFSSLENDQLLRG
jgi:hypothetical protein